MLTRSLARRVPQFRRNMATVQGGVEGHPDTPKRAAVSIFERTGMWPLILLTVGVGYFGYHYRANFVSPGPDVSTRKDRKTIDDLKKESRSETELVRKTIAEVDKDRDATKELVYSRGTLEKGPYESMPEGTKKPSEIRK